MSAPPKPGVPVAFYAPIKPPDHPVPSGDREMARLLWRALEHAGYAPQLASRLSALNLAGSPNLSRQLELAATAEIDGLLRTYSKRPDLRPRAWFTYHLYYKAPDLIGPDIARRLGIPYIVAEGSRAPKRAAGPWAEGHRQAEAALDAADLVLVLNPNDWPMLEAARPARQHLARTPPFLDPGEWPCHTRREADTASNLRLLTVAMMREGDKLASYRILGEALALLEPGSWTLDIVGDGRAREAVEALFAPFGPAVRLHGLVRERAALASLYASASVLVWPAVNEAFGMVFLEAALQGCPSIAGDYGGVGEVVRDGETGLLVPPGDAGVFAATITRFQQDQAMQARLSTGARRFAIQERSIDAAAAMLSVELGRLVGAPAALPAS